MVTCTFTNQKRGRDRGREGRHARRPAGLLVHGRRRAVARELLARRRLRRDAVEHAHVHDVAPGSGYSVSETVPSGWDQTSATCDDGSPVSNINVAPAEIVTCTFANRKRGQIVVVKDATPDDPQDFSFTAGGGLSPASFSARRRRQRDALEHPHLQRRRAGRRLLVAETRPERLGPDQRDLRRRQPGRRTSTSRAGETVTCTFANRKRAQLVVVKDALPERPAGLLLHGRRRPHADELPARRRRRRDALEHPHLQRRRARLRLLVAETVPSGWDQPSAIVQRRQPGLEHRRERGETVTCTFTNRKRGQIVVVKDARAQRPAGLLLHGRRRPLAASFSLDDDADGTLSNSRTFNDVVPGSGYSLAETVPGGWDQTARHLRRRQPGVEHRRRRRRDRHLHVHEPQARADRGRRRRRARRRAGLLVHGRRRPLARQLLARRRPRPGARPTRARSTTCPSGAGYSVAETVPAGWDLRARPATTAARCRTSTCPRARRSPARSRTTSAGRSWSSRTPRPTTRRTSRSRPAAAFARELLARRRRRPDAVEHAHVHRRAGRAAATRSRDGAERLGPDLGHLRRRQPGVEHRRRARRDRHLHLRQPQARPDRGRQGRPAQRPAGLRLHGRRRALPGELLARRRRRRDALEHAHVRERRAGGRLLAVRDGAERLGPDRAPPATTAARSRTSTSRRRDRHLHVHEPQARPDRGRQGRAPERRAGLRLHGGRRPLARELLARRRLRRDALEHAHVHRRRARQRVLASPRRCRAAGTRPPRPATTAARVEHRRLRGRDRHLHVHEPQARADRGRQGRACPTTRRTSPSRPAAGCRPRASRSTTTPTRRSRTRARSPTCRRARGYSLAETVPSGWDQTSATCDDGSPVSNIDVGPGRDRHLHVHEQQARADRRSRRTRSRTTRRTSRSRPAAGSRPASFSLDDDSDPTLSNTQRSTNVPAGSGYSRRRDRARRLGPDERDLRRRQPGLEHRRVRRRDVTCTFTNRKRGQIVVVKDAQPERPAGLRLHGRRRASPVELPARRRRRRDALEHAHVRERRPGGGYSLSRDGAERLGPDRARPATTAARCRTSTSRAGETVTCTFTNRKRGRIVVVEGRHAERPAGLLLHGRRRPLARELLARRRLRPGRSRTRARSPTSRRARATRSSETVPGRLGPDRRHLRRRQPGVEHRRRGRRDRHLHVHEPQARPASWSSRTRSPNDAAGLRLHGRRRPSPAELLRSTTTPTGRSRTPARSANVVPGIGLLGRRRRARRLGPDSATCDDGSPSRTSTSPPARPSPARSRTTASAAA